ncbi:hypothetical protein WS69_25270 [Burkholderia sp. BDU5]|nr:hypothetical protein WS69_25270 [Burkholderia sp. BDU5]
MLAEYPAPQVPSADANGGIRYQDVQAPDGLIQVRLGPVLSPQPIPGDLIELFWGEDPNDPNLDLKPPAAQLTIQEVTTYYVLNVRAAFVFEVGSGMQPVFFRLRTSSAWLYSEVTPIDVKLDVPGGFDPESSTEWINENLSPPVPESTDIGEDEAAKGVDVSIAPWENMDEGDRLTLAWSMQRISHPKLESGDVDQPVVVHVPPEAIQAGGDGDGLIVRYEIYDRVKNWSKWSLEARVNVEVDPNLLAAPLVVLAPSGELNLDELGSQDVQVMVMDAKIAPQSQIELTWNGQTADGNPVVRTVRGTYTGAFLFLNVPNEAAAAVAQGLAVLSYTATLAGVTQRSRRTTVRVIGEVQGLDAPSVEEAVGDELDPAGNATVRIEPYAIMEAGDIVLLRWVGAKANGDPTMYTKEQPITSGMKGNPVRIPIPAAELSVLNGGTVRVSYWVYPVGGGGPLESPEAAYRVGAEETLLPPPVVDYLDDGSGVLDPDRVPPAGTTLTVPAGANTQAGDEVRVEWLGKTGQPTDTYRDSFPVGGGTEGHPLPFPIDKSLVVNNLNASVTARYDVVRSGATLPAETVTFRVESAAAPNLPAPTVDGESGGLLDPDAWPSGTTLRVPAGVTVSQDRVDVFWQGRTGGEPDSFTDWLLVSAGMAGREVPFDVAYPYIDLNRGVQIEARYEITRAGNRLSSSVRAFLVGRVQRLPAPTVTEASGGVLDPADAPGGATVVVPVSAALKAGDEVTVHWEGAPGAGTTTVSKTVTGGGADKELPLIVPASAISPNIGRSVDIYYEVVRFNGGDVELSSTLTLRVEQTTEELLPPTMPDAQDGKLDPASVVGSGTAVVVAPYPGMEPGERVTLTMMGNGGGGSFTDFKDITGNSTGKPVDFSIPLARLVPNDGQAPVHVYFEVERLNGKVSQSSELIVAIARAALPAAEIDEADDDNLNPDDVPNGCTLRVRVAAKLRLGDIVELRWAGAPGDGSTTLRRTVQAGDVGKDLLEVLPFRYIEPNIGRTVELSYFIDRSDPLENETSPPSVYQVERRLGNGALLVLGARHNRSLYRESSAPRWLSAFNQQTSIPMLVEWQYEGEVASTSGTTFRDTKPHLLLHVRSADDRVTLNPANFVGSGSDSTATGVAAFVAHLDAGNMIGWGNALYGGNIPPTLITLDDIAEVTSTQSAFAARRTNNLVPVWGNASQGGSNAPAVEMVQVIGNSTAMAARTRNNSVVAWGTAANGATVPAPIAALTDIVGLYAAGSAFAGLRTAGHVIAWGVAAYGGTVPADIAALNDIADVCGDYTAFAALRRNGHVIAWGAAADGGTVPAAIAARNDIIEIRATARAFAVRARDGHVLAWGNAAYGGTVPADIAALNDIIEVSGTWGAFCARRANGTVVAWGNNAKGGLVPADIAALHDIVQVTGTAGAFAAIRRNGAVVAWGDQVRGGNTAPVAAQLTDVRAIYANTEVFAALTADKRVVTWGVAAAGGDSSAVQPVLRNGISYEATAASRGLAVQASRMQGATAPTSAIG